MLRWLVRIAGPSGTVRVSPARSPAKRPATKARATRPAATRSTGESSRSSTRPEFAPKPERNISTAETRSEEHTSELQSRENLVCRLLLEKKHEHTRDSRGD